MRNARPAGLLTAAILIGSPGFLCSAQGYRGDDRGEVATIAASRTPEPRGTSARPIPTAQPRQLEHAPSSGNADDGDRSLLDDAGLRIDPMDAEVWWQTYRAREQ